MVGSPRKAGGNPTKDDKLAAQTRELLEKRWLY
jgi:hypothetical protein